VAQVHEQQAECEPQRPLRVAATRHVALLPRRAGGRGGGSFALRGWDGEVHGFQNPQESCTRDFCITVWV
jgi:hypothetical protein